MTSRRHFLAGAGTLTGLALLPLPVWSSGGALRIRHEARSAEGRQMLQIYAQAVAAMKSAPETTAASWTFQWFTHAVGRGTKAAELDAIFGADPSPMKTLANLTWSTCKAHFAGDAESSFLPWHRAFVLVFETIIREVANNDTFTLPYWDYTVDASIPPEFRSASGATASLYKAARNNGINDGTPINQGRGAFDLSILNKPYYDPSSSGLVSGFNDQLDGSMHGNVHVWVGNGTNMGAVPTAASDPIFWLHHAMIDRMWASWYARNHANPTSQAWLTTSHHFANAQDTRVTFTNAQLTNTAGLGYRYDALAVPPAAAAVEVAGGGPPAAAEPVLIAQARDVRLTGERTEINLTPIVKAPLEGRFFLKINRLTTALQPGTVYDVQVPARGGAVRVGTLQFFDAAANKGADRPFVYALDVKVSATIPGSVTVVAQGQPDRKAEPVLGTVEIFQLR